MRKTLIIFILLLVVSNCMCQLNRFVGTWISKSNDFIEIRDTTKKNSSSNYLGVNGRDHRMSVFLFEDTLSFQERFYSSRTNYKKLYIKRFDLKVIKHNDTSLVVKPVSNLSSKLFKNRDEILFTKQEYSVDDEIILEKICFHTSYCFGTCPTYHLEIDSSKNVNLFIEEIYKKDSEFEVDKDKIGYYKGEIENHDYSKLVNLIRTCNLNLLKFDEADCCDGSVITIIVYYNGKRKYLKSMFPPKIANKLISFLYDLCENTQLIRTKEEFEIEK